MYLSEIQNLKKKETPLVQFSIVASGKDTEDMRFQ